MSNFGTPSRSVSPQIKILKPQFYNQQNPLTFSQNLSSPKINLSPSRVFQPKLLSLSQQLQYASPQLLSPRINLGSPQIKTVIRQAPENHANCNNLIYNLNNEIKKQQADLTILFSEKEQLLKILNQRDKLLLSKDSRIMELEQYCGEIQISEQNLKINFENTKRIFENQKQLMELEIYKQREVFQSYESTINNGRDTIRVLEEQNRKIPILNEENRQLRHLIDQMDEDHLKLKHQYNEMSDANCQLVGIQAKYYEMEKRTVYLTEELNRLNQNYSRKMQETEQLYAKVKDFNIIDSRNQEYEKRLNLLSQEIDRLNQIIQRLTVYESRCIDYESRINFLNAEMERMATLNNNLRNDPYQSNNNQKNDRLISPSKRYDQYQSNNYQTFDKLSPLRNDLYQQNNYQKLERNSPIRNDIFQSNHYQSLDSYLPIKNQIDNNYRFQSQAQYNNLKSNLI